MKSFSAMPAVMGGVAGMMPALMMAADHTHGRNDEDRSSQKKTGDRKRADSRASGEWLAGIDPDA